MASLGAAWAAVSQKLAEDVKAAWPDVAEVHLDLPPGEPALPYAVALVESVESEFGAARRLHQRWRVSIWCVWPRPAGGSSRMDEAFERHDALSLRLEQSSEYAGVGMLPTISDFDPLDEFEAREGAASCRLAFTFVTEQGFGE